MLVREQNQTNKSTGIFVSLTIHAVLVALLFLALKEKHLTTDFFSRAPQHTKAAPVHPAPPEPKKEDQPSQKADPLKKQPTLNQPFVVPAPVIFYGNQAMMNKPVPVSGHSEGKSAFEHTPSALPTPPAQAIAPERAPSIQAPAQLVQTTPSTQANTPQKAQERVEEKAETTDKNTTIEKETQTTEENSKLMLSTILDESARLETALKVKDKRTEKKEASQHSQQARKLTLADIFKNANNAISSFSQDGLPSARKAGTEGGDDQGSGHQITIKEGDMKYYTLWAKFLNHLNQAARFNRRGKESMINHWIQNRDIQYILQCGITVDMQGKVLDIDLMVSSGCPGFDKLCISDIKSAVPYPPLPESLGKKTARFEVNVYP